MYRRSATRAKEECRGHAFRKRRAVTHTEIVVNRSFNRRPWIQKSHESSVEFQQYY